MSAFIEWLESLNKKDTKVRAVLKRSLAFDPGTHVPAYPYVEPFLQGAEWPWRRTVHYLVAGLWAAHWREGRERTGIPLGRAAAIHQVSSGSISTENRFITLLDADEDQLPHRLRQIAALLKEQPLDFEHLLVGLLRWNDDSKRTQNDWARDFYRNIRAENGTESETPTTEEKL